MTPESFATAPTVSEEATRAAVAMAERRIAGEPLQYVTGVAGFRRLELSVGPGVFIPRPETELVAEKAMTVLPPGGTLVDVGTGSGAIALAIADERPDATVFATETSPDALAWAARNQRSTGARVQLILGDLLEALPSSARGAIDVVVANPPYIGSDEEDQLPHEVKGFEPHGALFAADDGLSVIRRIATDATSWLKPGGKIVLEIGSTQEEAVRSLLAEAGYADVAVSRDLAGLPRCAGGTWPGEIERGRPEGNREGKGS